MTLLPLHQQVVQLLAKGLTEQETADAVGKSKSWVQKFKKDAEVVAAIETARDEMIEAVKASSKDDLLQELREYRDRTKKITITVHNLGSLMLEKLQKKAELLDDDDLPGRSIPQFLKLTVDSLRAGQQMENEMLGLDRLVENIVKIEKLMNAQE